jgi:hypothetical protein
VKKRRDLRKIAQQVFDLCLHDNWRPLTRDMEKRFRLKEYQSRKVIQYAKELGEQLGLTWGYHRQVNYFRVATNAQMAKEILLEENKRYVVQGKSTRAMFNAAEKQGFSSKEISKNVDRMVRAHIRQAKLVEDKVKAL